MAKKKGKKCGGLVHKMGYKHGGKVKKKGYAQGGYVTGPDGKPSWVPDVNQLPPGTTLLNPDEMRRQGLDPTGERKLGIEDYGMAIGKTMLTGGFGAHSAKEDLKSKTSNQNTKDALDIAESFANPIPGASGKTLYSIAKRRKREKENRLIREEEEGGVDDEAKGLNDIEGDIALAQNQEDSFLKRADDVEEEAGPSGTDDLIEGVNTTLDAIPVVGQINRAANAIAAPIRNKAEERNPDGSLKNRKRAKRTAILGGFLNPAVAIGTRIKTKSYGFGAGEDYVSAIEEDQGFKDGGKVPSGYHRMPDGKLMKDSEHKGMMHGGKVKKGYMKGGVVEGKGTAKSDSIDANVEGGSFVVPAENAAIAKKLREKFLGGDKDKKANLKSGGNVDVNLSDGEHIFNPAEAAILQKNGINLNALAPHAKSGSGSYAEGGWTTIGTGSSSLKVWDTGNEEDVRYPEKPLNSLTDAEMKDWQRKTESRRLKGLVEGMSGTTARSYSKKIDEKLEKVKNPSEARSAQIEVMNQVKSRGLKYDLSRTPQTSETTGGLDDESIAGESILEGGINRVNSIVPTFAEIKANEKEEREEARADQTNAIINEIKAEGQRNESRRRRNKAQDERAAYDKDLASKDAIGRKADLITTDETIKNETLANMPTNTIDLTQHIPAETEEEQRQGKRFQRKMERQGRRAERRDNRDISAGDVANTAATLAPIAASIYQMASAEKQLREMDDEPKVTKDPFAVAVANRIGDESSFGMDSAQKAALSGEANTALRGGMQQINEGPADRGGKMSAKVALATNVANQASGNIAKIDADMKMKKLGMLPGMANLMQNVTTTGDLKAIEGHRGLQTALGNQGQAGFENMSQTLQFNRLMRERESRNEYQNKSITAGEMLAAINAQNTGQ